MVRAQESFDDYASKLKTIQSELSALAAEAKATAESTRVSIVQGARKVAASISKDATSAKEGMLADFRTGLSAELGGKVVDRAEVMIAQRLTGDERARLRKEFSRKLESAQ